MAGEAIYDADGARLILADGSWAIADAGGDCAECCGGGPCELPEPLSVCAAYDLFNLPPANPSQYDRHKIVLPLEPLGTPTTIGVRLRALIDWSGRGGTQLGDITGYVLRTGMLESDADVVLLRPATEKDAGGCWRVTEWRGTAWLHLTRVNNSEGFEVNVPVQVCARLRMTNDGWTLAIESLDDTWTGAFVCRRSNGTSDTVDGFIDDLHECTLEGWNQPRVPLASQVTGGIDRVLTAALAAWQSPDAGVVPEGCPPYTGVLFARAAAGTVCTPGLVTVPGRFRVKWDASYARRQRNVDGRDGTVTEYADDRTEEVVTEFRDPVTPPETAAECLVNNNFQHYVVKVNGVTTTDTTTSTSGPLVARTPAVVLQQMIVENQSMQTWIAGSIEGVAVYGGLSGCGGSLAILGGTVVWSGIDSLVERTSQWTQTRAFTFSDGSTSAETITVTKRLRVEPIDTLVCSGGAGRMGMAPVKSIDEAVAMAGKILRGEG